MVNEGTACAHKSAPAQYRLYFMLNFMTAKSHCHLVLSFLLSHPPLLFNFIVWPDTMNTAIQSLRAAHNFQLNSSILTMNFLIFESDKLKSGAQFF